MTLAELSFTFFKAHILMGAGCMIGEIIAHSGNMDYSWLFSLLIGLLFSLRLYSKCITVMIEEYKRLKFRNKNENLS